MTKPIIHDVSDTALWVAHYRAKETQRPDALFRDPLAARLAGEKGKEIAKRMMGSQYTGWTLAIRTYVIDAYIRELLAEGVDMVINLGAGLDTRPYRMDLPPNLRWVEVDFANIIRHKEEQLSAEKTKCRLERIAMDLSDATARRALFAKLGVEKKKILVLTEGVVPYLSPEQVAELATDLLSQPSFRFWLLDYFSPAVKRHMQSRKWKQQMRNSPFLFFPEDWPGFFSRLGWRLREMRYLGEVSQKIGRRLPLPWWARALIFFLRAEKKNHFSRMTGYALLEPK